jgi:CBS domain-containing protein
MISATMVGRVADFLKKHPPFYILEEGQLMQLSAQIQIRHYEKGEKIFTEGSTPDAYFYLVHKGSISLYKENTEPRQLADECDEGDIFGVRALLAGDNYIFTAEAAEQSLLYAIPNRLFRELLEVNPRLSLYFAAGFASGSPMRRHTMEEINKAKSGLSAGQPTFVTGGYLVNVTASREVVTCPPGFSVMEAAQRMTERHVDSIIIAKEDGRPLGIITDSDLRRKVVSNREPLQQAPVTSIMSAPVKTARPGITVGEMTLLLMREKVKHYCLTEDGTPNSPAIGVITSQDLLVSQGNNPAILLKEIGVTANPDVLKKLRDQAEALVQEYLRQDAGMDFIWGVITEINDALLRKALQLARAELALQYQEVAETPFCWLALGSEGRKEQILRTDVDNALLYADPAPLLKEKTAAYFLELGQKVNAVLIHCGFESCPAGIMASNPELCMPVSKWQKRFRQWIYEPEPEALLRANIYFDFRPVAGDEKLAQQLKEYIFNQIDTSRSFLNFLAKNAMQNPPPLSFFRNFVVEKSGSHKNEFDIKARAMMPLADAARVLAYDLKIREYLSTAERFQYIAKADSALASVCHDAAQAYEVLMRIRAREGFEHSHSGRYIDIKALNKLDRQTLRNIFTIIEEVQSMLRSRFQLNYMRT